MFRKTPQQDVTRRPLAVMGHTHMSWIRIALPVLLSALFLAAYQFAQPPAPESLKPKVFVLGLSKTGTTSIGDALERLGYRRLGWRDIRSRHMVHTWANGETEPLRDLSKFYDAFEDLPWPFMYQEMAEMYPDARFVLSLRKDEATWLRSMRAHVGRGKWLPYAYFYGADTVEGNEEIIVSSYRNHTEKIRDYFKDKPSRYIELNIDNGDINWDALCRIAQCPGGNAPSIGFPRSNTVASWNMGVVVNNLQWWWGWIVTRTEEHASHYYYHSEQTSWKPALSACWSTFDFAERVFTELYFRVVSPLVLPPVVAT